MENTRIDDLALQIKSGIDRINANRWFTINNHRRHRFVSDMAIYLRAALYGAVYLCWYSSLRQNACVLADNAASAAVSS